MPGGCTFFNFHFLKIIFIYSFKPRTARQEGRLIFFVENEQKGFYYFIDKTDYILYNILILNIFLEKNLFGKKREKK